MKTNRGQPAQDLRERLMAAALRLFREQGYSNTTVDAVVATAGMAKGTFFNFFPSKTDVLKAYYRDVDREISGARSRFDPRHPRRSLVRFARDVEVILRREGPLMKELLTLIATEPNLRRLDDESGAQDARVLREFLGRARSAGSLKPLVPLNDVVTAVMDLWAGAVREWVLEDQKRSLATLYAKRIGLLGIFKASEGKGR